jgi:DNA invertase Pin-like site-specific DNA recombinase
MADGKFIAYYRVSTDRQGRSGLGLEAQREAVTGYLNGGNWQLLDEFVEVESGKRDDNRPQLAAALAACRKHKATLVIAKLDRLARNVAFIANLMDSKAEFVAVDFPTANRLTLHIMAAFAEHEREMISARTKAALAVRKAQGAKLGNRTNLAFAQAKGGATVRREADAFAANVLPVIERVKATGATSYNAIAKALNERGVKTAKGGTWAAATVRNVMLRTPALDRAA